MDKEKQQYNDYGEVPYYRKQWFFWLMCLLFSPIAIGLLLTGDVYYKRRGEVGTARLVMLPHESHPRKKFGAF